MGKTKQVKEKKFDRNVEISAPILDPEIIKAIHSPPKGQRIDIRHGGFKALLSDLNSQDSMDEFSPVNDNYVPSYIGISCAVSGYSGYSSYNNNKKPLDNITNTTKTTTSSRLTSTPNRSLTSSPIASRDHHVRHITIDKNNIKSPDDERIKLTEELTASATERRRSPSPLPPLEDERHHGAYVGARYFPMPPPSKLVNRHIPLLGIDDDQDPDQVPPDDANKVEKKIATLYGDNFVEDWKESMSHKAKKEHLDDANEQEHQEMLAKKSPKDLVTLKPTPKKALDSREPSEPSVEVPTPNVRVLAGVEKGFLNRLLTDENPPMPKSSSSPQPTSPVNSSVRVAPVPSAPKTPEVTKNDLGESIHSSKSPPVSPSPQQHQQKQRRSPSPPLPVAQTVEQTSATPYYESLPSKQPVSPTEYYEQTPSPEQLAARQKQQDGHDHTDTRRADSSALLSSSKNLVDDMDDEDDDYDDQHSQSPQPPMSPDSGKSQSMNEEPTGGVAGSQVGNQTMEEHIEYEIRAQSPVDNQASPVRVAPTGSIFEPVAEESSLESVGKPLVSFSPEPAASGDHPSNQLKAEQPAGTSTNLLDLLSDDNSEPQSLLPAQIVNETVELIGGGATESLEATTRLPDEVVAEQWPVSKIADELLASTLTTTTTTTSESLQPTTTTTTTTSSSGVADGLKDMNDAPTTDVTADSDNNNKGSYYLDLLDQESSFILGQVQRAEAILAEREHEMDEDEMGRVRSAIGKANLLINKKCNQFKELCETSIKGDANEQYAVLNDDLAGFWDMLSIQFSDVRKSFEKI